MMRFLQEALSMVTGLHWVWYYYAIELIGGEWADGPEWRWLILGVFWGGVLLTAVILYFGHRRFLSHPIFRGVLVSFLVGPGIFAMGSYGFAPLPLMLFGALISLDFWNLGLNVILLAANSVLLSAAFGITSRFVASMRKG